MNDDAITLRPLRHDDYPAIADMLRRMWYSDPHMSLTCARRLAMIDLHHSLDCSNDAVVAQQGGAVVGIIATRIDRRGIDGRGSRPESPAGESYTLRDARKPCPHIRHVRHIRRSRWHRRHVIKLAMPLLLTAEGRHGLREMLALAWVDARLLYGLRPRFDAEVTLLLVDETARGCGVGRALFDHAMRRFRDTGVDRYFLFTDTSCNVGFYEHRGLARLRERRLTLRGDATETFYLYEGRA